MIHDDAKRQFLKFISIFLPKIFEHFSIFIWILAQK